MTLRPSLTTTLASALLVATATLPLRDVFGDWSWALSVFGAAAVGAAVATIAESLRRDLPVAVVVVLVAVGAALWALLVPLGSVFFAAPLSSAPWGELRTGTFRGWGGLLDEQLPLTDPQRAETFATVLAWVAAATSVHITARRHTAFAAIAASATVLWVCTAAALPRGLTPAVFGAGAGVMALVAISTLTRVADQRWRVGRVLSIAAVISLAGGAATLAASASTGRDPLDPRSSNTPDVVEIDVPDILAEFGVRREGDGSVLTIDSAVLPSSLRLRLQVYDTHNGERWLPATDFVGLPTFPDPEVAPPGDVVELDVIVNDLDGPWVPLPDRLIDASVSDFQWSEDTQTAIMADPVERYQVTGAVVSRAGIGGGEGGADTDTDIPVGLSAVPDGLPASIQQEALAVTEAAIDDLDAIDAITARIRELGRDETLAPGHSFARLDADLTNERASGAEQLASLHALMLRAVGIPSRLVVGYVATSPVVVSSDLQVWTEAAFPGVGWVAFDPVPAAAEPGADPEVDPTNTPTTLPDRRGVTAQAAPSRLDPGEDPDEAEFGVDDPLTRRDAAFLAVAAVVVLLVSIFTARTVRRRLRQSTDLTPEVRVLGAWAELVDRLRELGSTIRSSTTIDDIVALVAAVDPAAEPDTRALADLASRALHSPDGSTPEEAEQAWERLHAIEAHIREVGGRSAALRRFLDPRPLHYPAPQPPPSRQSGRRAASIQLSRGA